MPAKRLKLRRADQCIGCGDELPAGLDAWWDSALGTVRCVECAASAAPPAGNELDAEPLDVGVPGGSLAREHERRRAGRERRTREAHPHIAGLLLALRDAPSHEVAFQSGEQGEKAVAEAIMRRTADGPATPLHNRRMPRGRGDIDHIAVAPAGVFVIDTKNLKGSVQVRRHWRAEPQLLIDGRDRTKLIDGLDRQVRAVEDSLHAFKHLGVLVQGVLCFTRADLPILSTLQIRGHLLLYRKALTKRLTADGPLDHNTIDAVARSLAAAFPAA